MRAGTQLIPKPASACRMSPKTSRAAGLAAGTDRPAPRDRAAGRQPQVDHRQRIDEHQRRDAALDRLEREVQVGLRHQRRQHDDAARRPAPSAASAGVTSTTSYCVRSSWTAAHAGRGWLVR